MKTFTYTATVSIEAENREDAKIELLFLMDNHDIDWELVDAEEQ